MKEYIIFPTHQTDGMYGYSAIAIEKTPENIADLHRMVAMLDEVRKLDSTISNITYDNPMVDIILLNDDFEPMVDKIYIEELDDDRVDELIEEGECKLNAPEMIIYTYQLKIVFDAEYTTSQVFCDFSLSELNEVLIDN